MSYILWPRTMSLAATGLVLSLPLAASALGCSSSASCGAAPSVSIFGFVVTTATGNDSTDADIIFCVTRKSTGAEECTLLDIPGENDFEWNEVNTFEWNLATLIAPGDLDGFFLRNEGGAPFLADAAWDLESLRVEAVLEGGGTALIYEDEEASVNLAAGETYDSSQCDY